MNDTRKRLLDAALHLLDGGGPAAVTLREVGRVAAVSRSAPYRHFADKDALLAAVAAGELDRVRHQRGPEGLAALLLRYVRWARRYPERFHLVFGRWDRDDPNLARAADESQRRFTQAVVEAQAQAAAPQGDPERIGALLRALAHGAADLAISGHLRAQGKGHASAEDLVRDILGYLRAVAAPSTPSR